MNERKDDSVPTPPTPDESVPSGDGVANTLSGSPSHEPSLSPFEDTHTLPEGEPVNRADNASVNLDKTTPAEGAPAASGVPSGGVGESDEAGGQSEKPEAPERHSGSFGSGEWDAYLPLGITFIVLGIALDSAGVPYLAMGVTFFAIYLSTAFKGNDRDG